MHMTINSITHPPTPLPALVLLVAAVLAAAPPTMAANDDAAPKNAPKAALTVNTVLPQRSAMVLAVSANGSITAWQEAIVGAEANGLRLADVRVNVGDVVKRGQLLASFATEMMQADLAQQRATLAEAEATLAEAASNAQRARDLQPSGVLSAQQIQQSLTAERTAAARVDAQRAALRVQQLRVAQTQVLAPDHGVISSRSATVGAVMPAGQELFRLIRQGRLEWRAEVAAADLALIKPGQAARVLPNGAAPVNGKVRMVAPTVDPATRNGLVYVDLDAMPGVKAGMFARGDFDIGERSALTLPQSAVLQRDGFAWIFKVGADGKVSQNKVAVGRRAGERVEVVSGLDASTRVVASGGGFLADGDLVRVVDVPAAAAAASMVKPAAKPAPK